MKTSVTAAFTLVTALGLCTTGLMLESHCSYYPQPRGARACFVPRPNAVTPQLSGGTPHGSLMVRIEGGESDVGSPYGLGLDNEHPQRKVRVRPFWIDQTEVTCTQYASFLNAAKPTEQARRSYVFARGEERAGQDVACLEYRAGAWQATPGSAHQPVFWVSSLGSRAFCEYYGLRLPTEVEWEAAAGTSVRAARDGSLIDPPAEGAVLTIGESRSTRRNVTPDSGVPRSLDLIGNVSEFVIDKYDAKAWEVITTDDPRPVDRGTRAVIKGGAYVDTPEHARVHRRVFSHALQCRFPFTGFRCAGDAE